MVDSAGANIQSHPIRLNGSDEWPGDTVRDCMEGRKRK